jgi:hypothetical protein
MILAEGNRSNRRKFCPIATFFTTNPTWMSPRMNPGLCGGRPATNQLRQGMALKLNFMSILHIYAILTSQKTLHFHCKHQSLYFLWDVALCYWVIAVKYFEGLWCLLRLLDAEDEDMTVLQIIRTCSHSVIFQKT